MSTYHNAVTDILFISRFLEKTSYTVFSKDISIKWTSVEETNEVPTVLREAIFTKSYLAQVNQAFTLTPTGVEDPRAFYQLNHGEVEDLTVSDLDEFTIVSSKTDAHLFNQFSQIQLHQDISIWIDFLDTRYKSDALFFCLVDDILTVLAWKGGKFQLANRYDAHTKDELFYYVMLVINQLDLSAETLQFETLTQMEANQYTSLFHEYVSPLKGLGSSMEQESEHLILSEVLASCVL